MTQGAINGVLIDAENVLPAMAELMALEVFQLLVFVGASHTRVDFQLADLLASPRR